MDEKKKNFVLNIMQVVSPKIFVWIFNVHIKIIKQLNSTSVSKPVVRVPFSVSKKTLKGSLKRHPRHLQS